MNMLCTRPVERVTMNIMLRFAFAILLAAVTGCELYVTGAPSPDAGAGTTEPLRELHVMDTAGTHDAPVATHPPFPEPTNCVGWGCDAGTP